MMKITTLFRITYLTILVVLQITFWGCGSNCSEPCQWSEVDEAAKYEFTLEVDDTIEHTDITENTELERILKLNKDSTVVKFKVQSICEDGTGSEIIEDTFEFLFTVAAVEVVYCRENQIPDLSTVCSNYCEYAKFDPKNARASCNASTSRLANYYFSIKDFCDCTENDFDESFIKCLKTKHKQLFGSDRKCPE